MANSDVAVRSFLYQWAIPIAVCLLGTLFLKRKGKDIHRRFFAWFMARSAMGIKMRELQDSMKKELFSDLENVQSLHWELKNEGLIRIVEIGVGSGVNFKYYPKNCLLTVVDPNPHFQKYFEENSQLFPSIKIEKFILGKAEHLNTVEDGYADVVVCTLVLCSVENWDHVLSEVKRVLAPGGRFYFLEHTMAPEGNRIRSLQNLLTPVWSILMDGCRLNIDLEKIVDNAQFSEVKIKRKFLDMKNIFTPLVGHQAYGFAIK